MGVLTLKNILVFNLRNWHIVFFILLLHSVLVFCRFFLYIYNKLFLKKSQV